MIMGNEVCRECGRNIDAGCICNDCYRDIQKYGYSRRAGLKK